VGVENTREGFYKYQRGKKKVTAKSTHSDRPNTRKERGAEQNLPRPGSVSTGGGDQFREERKKKTPGTVEGWGELGTTRKRAEKSTSCRRERTATLNKPRKKGSLALWGGPETRGVADG